MSDPYAAERAAGTILTAPCGCKFQPVSPRGYINYVHPDCPFDNRFHAPITGITWRRWDELPEEER